MSVYEYQGEPGLGYLRLPCAHGTVPITGLQPGELVDFGGYDPPNDGRWVLREDAGEDVQRMPDNAPQLAKADPEPEPEDAPPATVTPIKAKQAKASQTTPATETAAAA